MAGRTDWNAFKIFRKSRKGQIRYEIDICRIQYVPQQHWCYQLYRIYPRIDCNIAEEGLRTTPCSQCALDALAIDNLLEYARLYLNHEIQIWIDAEDCLDIGKSFI